MRKEELRQLRTLLATKEMIEKGKRTVKKEVRCYWNPNKHIVEENEYETLVRIQNLKGFIKIAIFLPDWLKKDIKVPRYEIFVNPKGQEWITRELDKEGKEIAWREAMVWNLDGVRMEKIYINNDAMKTLQTLQINGDEKGLKRLMRWQQAIKEEDLKRREAAEQEPWDEDMKLTPALPAGFGSWMKRHAVKDCFIFYELKKSRNQGYCSKCQKIVKIKDPKHNVITKCPSCKTKALFKSKGMIKTLETGTYYAEIIQKIDGGIMIREFDQRQYWRGTTAENPHIRTNEKERILIFENGIVKRYYYGAYKNKYIRWILDKNYYPTRRTYWYRERVALYKRNFSSVRSSRIFKNSAIELWDNLPTDIASYLECEKGNPAIEKLAKIGMFKLADEIIKMSYDSQLLNQNETELPKLLKIDKQRLKRLKEMDGNVETLRWMQIEKMANTIWPDQMIKRMGAAGISTSRLNFLNAPINYVRAFNYLDKQSKLSGETLQQTVSTWRDYIYMADQLKMNTKLEQIGWPKDLKAAHDECIAIREAAGMKKQAKEIEKKWPKVNKQLPKLSKYEFADGKYCIVSPKSVFDIVKEGTILHHCVHTCEYYFERIQTDESYLFFLRKTQHPDVPWYTLEVEPSGNIRQKRTTGDNQNKDFQDAIEFLKKWQKHFQKQLTKKEKELGAKADKLRKENYENLRKKGNKVWHGKLAGQLLADVLEADFMEAM